MGVGVHCESSGPKSRATGRGKTFCGAPAIICPIAANYWGLVVLLIGALELFMALP